MGTRKDRNDLVALVTAIVLTIMCAYIIFALEEFAIGIVMLAQIQFTYVCYTMNSGD